VLQSVAGCCSSLSTRMGHEGSEVHCGNQSCRVSQGVAGNCKV